MSEPTIGRHCPRDPYNDVICLYDGKSAKSSLANLWNGWLQPSEMKLAKEIAARPGLTEEEADERLRQFERAASSAMGYWRMSQ